MTKTPQLKAAPKTETKAPRLTREMLADYLSLVEAKKTAEATARRLEKEMATLKEKLTAFAEANSNDATTCGYRIRLVEGARYPAWKTAFVEALGEDKAAEVTEATPPSIKLEVTPA